MLQKFRENWVRPALFFGNNPISLAGGAITSASGVTMLAYWLVEIFGRSNDNPYLGIIFFLILPALFVAGLALIPVGVFLRRRALQKAGHIPAEFPKVDFNDKIFRHGVDIVLLATIANLLIVSVASYRGAAYMDSPQFCGQSCHVMHPEYTAYKVSAHSHVDCVACHIGSGAESYVKAKVNGTKQLIEVSLHPMAGIAPRFIPDYPTPIPSPVMNLRPAREICEGCHTPARFIGEKLLVKSTFADDEKNSQTQSVVVLHLGGRESFSHLTGIHGVHLGHIEYITTDPTRTTIPWVQKRNEDGSTTDFVSSTANGVMPKGERRVMDCIDCHNRASHTFVTAEEAINRAMAEGVISPDLPWVHKEGLQLLKANYASQDEARVKIPAQLTAFYRASNPQVLATKAALVKSAGEGLVTLYSQNVFPDMKVTWGTHPNHIGHMSYPGCFRCHDGDHSSKDGKSITQDCAACHNLLAVDETKPKVLSDLGIQ
ncbi:MAG: NapC/NirT family cytochrome c [Terracidiphilus sp.]|nr:NapC/NirT family cytochrome c [Terracidiphilus sp.]MDR3775761.1 NapC/NirT family cytochrome c [Terracidiphilus sp.]